MSALRNDILNDQALYDSESYKEKNHLLKDYGQKCFKAVFNQRRLKNGVTLDKLFHFSEPKFFCL